MLVTSPKNNIKLKPNSNKILCNYRIYTGVKLRPVVDTIIIIIKKNVYRSFIQSREIRSHGYGLKVTLIVKPHFLTYSSLTDNFKPPVTNDKILSAVVN